MAPLDGSDDNDLLVALRHPLRRRILQAMADGQVVSPRELALTLRHPLSNVSYHVRVLAGCGAVTLVEMKPVRGSVQHLYRCTVRAPWARQVLGIGEASGAGAGESPDGAGA